MARSGRLRRVIEAHGEAQAAISATLCHPSVPGGNPVAFSAAASSGRKSYSLTKSKFTFLAA